MGSLILWLLACAWPVSAPAPSQPYTVEVSLGASDSPDDTGRSIMAPTVGATQTEAQAEAVGADADPRPGESQARTDPRVGSDHAD